MNDGDRIIILSGGSPDRIEILMDHLQSVPAGRVITCGIRDLEQMEKRDADLLILDLTHHKGGIPDLVKRIRRRFPASRILALHIYRNRRLVESLLNSGLDGYLEGDPSVRTFLRVVDRVLKGENVVHINGVDTKGM